MKNRVVKNKRNQYVAYCSGKTYTYSIDRYGEERAKQLAEMSLTTGLRHHDYYEVEDDVTRFYVVTKAYGEVEVLFDTDDLTKVIPYKLSISNDNHAKTSYCKVINGTGIHRIIMDAEAGDIIDHINRNGLDNRRENLRIVNTSINNRNSNIRTDNSTGYKGVTYERGRRYKAEWYDESGAKHSKSFSILKYGEEESKKMAIEYRILMEKQNNYLAAYERSETIETVLSTVATTE